MRGDWAPINMRVLWGAVLYLSHLFPSWGKMSVLKTSCTPRIGESCSIARIVELIFIIFSSSSSSNRKHLTVHQPKANFHAHCSPVFTFIRIFDLWHLSHCHTVISRPPWILDQRLEWPRGSKPATKTSVLNHILTFSDTKFTVIYHLKQVTSKIT